MKTKQTTNSTLTRRIFLGMLLLMFTSLSTFVFAQPPLPPNLPVGYFENAGLANPSNDYPVTFENAFWTVNYDEQLKDCLKDLNFATWITIVGPELEPTTKEIPIDFWTGDYKLNSKKIRELFGINGLPGLYFASHIAFQLKIAGSYVGPVLFPGYDKSISISGLPAPCDCLRIVVDERNHAVNVYPGYCN